MLAVSLAVLARPGVADAPWLVDATAASGVDFVHVRSDAVRYWLPEIMSGGVCLIDFDRDGDLDLYLVQGGSMAGWASGDPGGAPGTEPPHGSSPSAPDEPHRNVLYRNDGVAGFVRRSAEAGVDDPGYGMGCAIGDVNGDGWDDLYVTNLGPNALYVNRGDGTFERARPDAGVDDPAWGSSGAFLDYDLDGDLDLFVVNYIDWSPGQEIECFSGGLRDYCHPDRYRAPAPDRLFRNRGDGRFEDVTGASGVAAAYGNGLGVAVGDLDADGWPDVYVANDGMPNQLWRNQGDGTFRDVALLAGAAVNRVGTPEAGMGVQAFDVDDDLDLDLLITHLRAETNTLYVNQGGGLFADLTATSGLGAASLGFTGFGMGFADFDSDRRVDLFVANGRVGRGLGLDGSSRDPFAEPDHLYRGLGGGRFELSVEGSIAGVGEPMTSRGAAFGDIDSDGDVDLLVVGSGGGARLLVNRVGQDSGWSGVVVLGESGASRHGSRVVLSTASGRQLRLVEPAYGYCTANESRAHFGLGRGGRIESIEVETPDGARRRYLAPAGGATLVLADGREGGEPEADDERQHEERNRQHRGHRQQDRGHQQGEEADHDHGGDLEQAERQRDRKQHDLEDQLEQEPAHGEEEQERHAGAEQDEQSRDLEHSGIPLQTVTAPSHDYAVAGREFQESRAASQPLTELIR
jgi:hypothetical protein